ncbi:MAG: hypothetical protein ACREHD_34745, partial [Pirellulales bacterium]
MEEVRVGKRLVAHNPDVADVEYEPTAVNPATWKLLRLHAEDRWADGTVDNIEIEALQPGEQLDARGVAVGRVVTVPLDLVEMGLPEGVKARVVAIERCPPIDDAAGHVVLTTISHLNSDVYELTLEDAHG